MKGVNFKTFFLNHGEKFGFGLFVVLALAVLLLGTSWGRYERTPAELQAEAEKADKVIRDSTWPDSEEETLTDWTDIVKRIDLMLVGMDASKYQLTTELSVPVYPISQPISEPPFFAPEKMLATASEVLIELPPKEEDEEDADSLLAENDEGGKSKVDDKDVPAEFRKRKPRVGEEGDVLGGGEYPGGVSPMDYAQESDLSLGEFGDEYGMEGEGEEKKALEGEGHRFVAVRGIIDWQAQKAAYAKALNLPPDQAGIQEPTLNGFEIERQKMVAGSDPWSGPWEKLDITNSIDVIEKAIDLEPELLDITITDPAITEPIPRRVIGDWSKWASHPAVENFQLSPEEQEAEQLRQEKLLQVYKKGMAGQNQAPEPVEPGGFKKVVHNVRGIESEMGSMMGMGDSGYSDMMRDANAEYMESAKEYGYEDAMGGGGLLQGKRTAASGRLMLFRYFDFDVEPGATYRYRVRVQYLNPNFGRPIDTLAQPEFQVGQTRYSDWSEPTPPATVRPEAEYFLTDIKKGRGAEGENASMDVFQWRHEFGTVVNQVLEMGVGDSIAQVVRARVVNPLDETYEDKRISISTGDILVDLVDDRSEPIDGTLADLDGVPARVRYDQAVVLTSSGKLKVVDPITNDKDRRYARKMQEYQNNLGKEYEEAAKKADEALEGLLEGGEGGEGGDYGEGGGRRKKRGRRRSNAASYSCE